MILFKNKFSIFFYKKRFMKICLREKKQSPTILKLVATVVKYYLADKALGEIHI